MSDAPDPPKPRGRPFPKGVSPNPGGIPRSGPVVKKVLVVSFPDLDDAYLAAAPKALGLLVAVIEDPLQDTGHRVRAALGILDKVKANATPTSKDVDEETKQKKALEDFVEAMKRKPPSEGGSAPS